MPSHRIRQAQHAHASKIRCTERETDERDVYDVYTRARKKKTERKKKYSEHEAEWIRKKEREVPPKAYQVLGTDKTNQHQTNTPNPNQTESRQKARQTMNRTRCSVRHRFRMQPEAWHAVCGLLTAFWWRGTYRYEYLRPTVWSPPYPQVQREKGKREKDHEKQNDPKKTSGGHTKRGRRCSTETKRRENKERSSAQAKQGKETRLFKTWSTMVYIKALISCCAVALLRWRNIWVKIAVLCNSRREAGCAQRSTRILAHNILRPRRFFFVAAFFSSRRRIFFLSIFFLIRCWRGGKQKKTFFAIRRTTAFFFSKAYFPNRRGRQI